MNNVPVYSDGYSYELSQTSAQRLFDYANYLREEKPEIYFSVDDDDDDCVIEINGNPVSGLNSEYLCSPIGLLAFVFPETFRLDPYTAEHINRDEVQIYYELMCYHSKAKGWMELSEKYVDDFFGLNDKYSFKNLAAGETYSTIVRSIENFCRENGWEYV